MITIFAFMIAFFFAANIGASGTAATMGAVYGGGAIKSRIYAVSLAAIFALLGAIIGGYNVTFTLSEGLVPANLISLHLAIIILTSASITLFTSNKLGIPLSTSEVTVGSIVGVGLAYQQVFWGHFAIIVVTWLLLPCIAYGIANAAGRIFRPLEKKWLNADNVKLHQLLRYILITAGCFEAFSAGMNNVANAIGPLVSSGLMNIHTGLWLGGLMLAIGSIVWGGKVLETNGKKITRLNLIQGSIVSYTGGTLVLIASLFGVPVPLTQATTMAIIGVGGQKVGFAIFKKPIVKKIVYIWVVSPIASLFLSYSFVQILILKSYAYITLLVVLGLVFIGNCIKLNRFGETFNRFWFKHRKNKGVNK